MATKISCRPALEDDAIAISRRMRRADMAEVWAQAGLDPLEGIRLSMAVSKRTIVGLVNGRHACIFGIASRSLLSDCGVPWLLGTKLIERHQLGFLRRCGPMLEELAAGFGRLENYVDARNAVSIKWLGWLGFTIEAPEPYGPFGLPFRRFHKELGG